MNSFKFFLSLGCLALAMTAGVAHADHAAGESVMSGTGKTKFNGLLQVWSVAGSDVKTNFRIRRAEMKFSGSVAENSSWFLMVDPSKAISTASGANFTTYSLNGDQKILQDIGMTYMPHESWAFTVGQFKTLATAESLMSSADLWFPERSLLSRTYGEFRDQGVKAAFTPNTTWDAHVMVSNGQGTNQDDLGHNKDLHARLNTHWMDKALNFGGFVTAPNMRLNKDGRYGLNADYGSFWKTKFMAEAVLQNLSTSKSNILSWNVALAHDCNDQWQPVLRYDTRLDAGSTAKIVTGGLNYRLLNSHSKISFAYSMLKNVGDDNGSPKTLVRTGKEHHLFVLAFQTAI